jgi:GNAT superfamily N-acetyltransferase
VSLHHESAFRDLIPYRAEKIKASIMMGTRQKGGMIGVIDADDGDRIIASIGLWFTEWWWSDAPVIMTKWLYVRPEARHAGVAHFKALFEFGLWVRQEIQGDIPIPVLLELTHDSAIDDTALVERKDRLFARFARRVGSVFLAGLPSA